METGEAEELLPSGQAVHLAKSKVIEVVVTPLLVVVILPKPLLTSRKVPAGQKHWSMVVAPA